ncbi:MAG: STAS/SEC14 domain-containing protein [Verrucomicrobia bacterium]|nr:STAS/SEC14 domain-containing protein [Verrucomicrobiota bacterium]
MSPVLGYGRNLQGLEIPLVAGHNRQAQGQRMRRRPRPKNCLSSAVRHFRFVRDHHRKIKKIAVVTDSRLGDAAEHITSHFVAATIRHFASTEVDEARTWIASD